MSIDVSFIYVSCRTDGIVGVRRHKTHCTLDSRDPPPQFTLSSKMTLWQIQPSVFDLESDLYILVDCIQQCHSARLKKVPFFEQNLTLWSQLNSEVDESLHPTVQHIDPGKYL